MATIQQFEDLDAWKQARLLVSFVYQLSRQSSFATDRSLQTQIRRAAVSIMANIAEGFERVSTRERLNFWNIARASCGEVRCFSYVCEDIQLLRPSEADRLRKKCARVGMLISGLIRSLRARAEKRTSDPTI